ncbi:hypothetical protein C8J56DRAFT_1054275 [Mycena floridula]|nr:hypothetical protein C8J56DRAFT_1054275 [Mycena floridula]
MAARSSTSPNSSALTASLIILTPVMDDPPRHICSCCNVNKLLTVEHFKQKKDKTFGKTCFVCSRRLAKEYVNKKVSKENLSPAAASNQSSQDIEAKDDSEFQHLPEISTCQHKAKKAKHEGVKHRDKDAMESFACKGWLHITLSESSDIAFVKIRHDNDHVPYWCIDVPEDIQQGFEDIWSCYRLWAAENSKKWKRDDDEVKSAHILLEEACKLKNLPADDSDGFTAIAFALPESIRKWGGQIRELALDSAWNTNHSSFEVYVLLGEVYGSGLPLGYLLIQSNQGVAGGKEQAIKRRLSILRRQPAPYKSTEASSEFHFIDPTFVPVAQRTKSQGDQPVASQVALPILTLRIGGVLVEAPAKPKLVIRINGGLRTVLPVVQNIEKNDRPVDDESAEDLEAELESWTEMSILSKDKSYVFCPAPHRKQLLRLFTKHFCQHTLFLERDGRRTAEQIRQNGFAAVDCLSAFQSHIPQFPSVSPNVCYHFHAFSCTATTISPNKAELFEDANPIGSPPGSASLESNLHAANYLSLSAVFDINTAKLLYPARLSNPARTFGATSLMHSDLYGGSMPIL